MFFDLGVEVPKQVVKSVLLLMTIHFGQSAFSLQSGSGSSKTNSEKWGVANDNLFWAGENKQNGAKVHGPFCYHLH